MKFTKPKFLTASRKEEIQVLLLIVFWLVTMYAFFCLKPWLGLVAVACGIVVEKFLK